MHDRTTDKNGPETASSRWRQILLNRWLLAGVAAVVLYALLGFLLTPFFHSPLLKQKQGDGKVEIAWEKSPFHGF